MNAGEWRSGRTGVGSLESQAASCCHNVIGSSGKAMHTVDQMTSLQHMQALCECIEESMNVQLMLTSTRHIVLHALDAASVCVC